MNLQYHIHKSDIRCPCCNEECSNDDEVSQDPSELMCDCCGQAFWVEMDFVYSTYSDCTLNETEHEWVQSESLGTLFNCKNCSQYKVEGAK